MLNSQIQPPDDMSGYASDQKLITGVESDCMTAMQGAHHVLLFIIPKPPFDRKGGSTFVGEQ